MRSPRPRSKRFNRSQKTGIALIFVAVMIFSGVGVMGFEALSHWNPEIAPPLSPPHHGIMADTSGGDSYIDEGHSLTYTQTVTAYAYQNVDITAYLTVNGYTSSTQSWNPYVSSTDTNEESHTFSFSYTWPSDSGSSGGTSYSWEIHSSTSSSPTGTTYVYTPPSISGLSGTSGKDANQAFSFSVSSETGGSPSLTYEWNMGNGQTETSSGSSITYTYPASGTYTVSVYVEDSSSVDSNTLTMSTTVDSDPSITISSNINPSDVGQSVDFSTAVSGGTGSYTSYSYVLYDGTSTSDSQLTSGTASSFSYTFSSTGQFMLDYSVTDSNGYTGSSSLTQTVYPDPQAYLLNDMAPGVFYVYSYTSGPTEGAVPYSDISSYPLTMPDSFPNNVSTWAGTFNDGGFGFDYGNPGYTGQTFLGRPNVAYPSSLSVLNTEPSGGAYDEGYMAVTVLYFNAGTYTFYGEYDDNGAMFISNNGVDWTSIIGNNAWVSEGATEYSGTETLFAGWYFFAVDNGNMGGGPSMSALNITGGTISTSRVPPIVSTTDSGVKQFFLSSVMGGTGSGYTYSFTGTGTTYTTQAFNASLSSGSYTVDLSATDGVSYSASSSAVETVNSDPTVSASSNVSSADVNYPIEFSSSPSGGTSPYTYSWTIGGTQVSTSQDFSYSFSTAGSYTVDVTVTDSVGETYSASVTVTINNNPSVSISSSQNPTDVGNSVTFTASESGGTGTISYEWYVNGASEGSGSTLDYSFSSSGSYTVEVVVTDSDGHTASYSITETVYSDPSVSISSSQNPTDVGNSVTFTASPSGGSGSYTYQWYESGSAISGATSSTYTVSFSSSGTYDFYVIIHDSVGNSAQSSTLDETVNADPSVSISSSQNPTDMGNSVTFTASASGGTGSYSYQWYLNSAAVSGATSSTYTASFSSSGIDSVYVVLTDGLGNTATSSTLTQTVNTDPSVSIASSQNPTDVGDSITFTATGTGGTGAFSYVWYLNGATQSSTTSTFSTSFSSAGTYYINVTVEDTLGDKASYSFKETVNADPSVAIASSQNPTDVGNSVTFTASGSSGTGSYSYQWYLNGNAVSGATNASYTTSFSSAGSDSVYVILIDGAGNTATSSTITETVNADPSVSIASSQEPTDAENSVTFTASITGGTSPYSYAWYNDGTLESSTAGTYTTSFSTSGSYTIEVIITDANGNKAYDNYTETVNADPTVSIISSQNPTDVGNSVTFTATGASGTSPYSYQWYYGSNSTAISGATGYEYTTSFSASGTYEYYVILTDANGNTARSYINETVNPDPSVAVSESPSPTDVNVSVTFTSSPSGGTVNSSGYNYTWDINGFNYYTQDVTVKFTSSGTYSAQVTIRDANGNTATATESIVVNPDPTVSISTQYDPVYSDTNDTLYAHGNYGTGSYNYTWENLSASGTPVIGYGPALIYKWGQSGSYALQVTIRDGLNQTANAHVTISVQPHPDLYISGPTNITIGKSNTWTLVLSNVTTGGTVKWIQDGVTLANETSPQITFTWDTDNVSIPLEAVYTTQGTNYTSTIHIDVHETPAVSITAKYSTVDVGVGDVFSPIISGGSPGSTYHWSINGTVFGSKDVSYAFTSAGTYLIKLTATDGDGVSASAETNVTVLSDPSVSISTPHSQYDTEYAASFSADATDGNGSYKYQWYLSGNAVSGAASQDFLNAFTQAGSYTVWVVVKDSFGVNATSNVLTVNIVNQPTVKVSASRDEADIGQPITFTSTIFNGTGPYTYEWFIGSSTGVFNASSFIYSFSTAGTYTVEVSIKDADGYTAVANVTVTISADPSVTATVAYPKLDTGATETFTASVAGGLSSYAYDWILDGNTISNSASFTYTFNSVGNRTVEVIVTDANGYKAYANVTVDVASHPFASYTKEYREVDVNIVDIFNSAVQYGTAPYNYTWYVDSGIVGYGTSLSYAFISAQVAYVNLTVRDADGYTYTATGRVYVVNAPSVSIFANKTTLDQGMSIAFLSGVSNGISPYNYTWEVNGAAAGYGATLDYAFTAAGTYKVTLTVRDSFGQTGSASVSILVNSPLSVSVSPSATSIDSGQTDAFTGTVSGGTGPYHYSWSVGGTIVGSSLNLSYPFSNAGTYTIRLTVTDSLGVNANYTLIIIVNPTLSGAISIQYGTVDENITDNVTLTASNGTSPYTYAIFINGALASSSDSYAHYFTTSGVYYITAYVNDSAGESVLLRSTITVRINPTVSIVTPTNKTDANVPVQFRGVLSGGTGPYSYAWLIGGHTYTNSTLTHSFTSTGDYAVQLTVTDSFGREAITSINETIIADPHAALVVPSYMKASLQEPLSLNISGGIPAYRIQWYFPSGEQYSGNNITHAFSNAGPETIETQVTDSTGYVDTQNFTVNVHLYVAIAANQTRGPGPLSVQFSSSVLGGTDYAYNWTFSPGHYSLLQDPTYQFPVGNYTVHFSVTSANGASGQANLSIQSLPPPVSFEYSSGLNITQAFSFRAIPNWDARGPYNMSWSFSNGQTITGMNISYKFPVYNELNTVIASFSYGNGKTWTQYLTVRMVPAVPVLAFSPPSIIPEGTMLSLNATASAPDSSSFTYSWDINGTSESGQSVLYYFQNPGNYSVSVTVTDGLGASATVHRIIEVLPQGSNSSIAISYTRSVNGPMDYYTIKVLSTSGIIAVEAFLGTTPLNISEINSTYTASGELAYFNLSMDQRDYPAGTYGISIVAFNNNSQSNHFTVEFQVTSQYSSSTFSLADVIAFFGGFSNFLIAILTIGGLVIAFASLRRQDNPDLIVQGLSPRGKSEKIVLKGKK